MPLFFSFSLFFLSYLPLWACILIKDILSIKKNSSCITTEIISITLISFCTVLSYIAVYKSLHRNTTENSSPFTIVIAKEEKMLSAEYICTFVLPLLVFDFTLWDQVVLFLIFFGVLGYLCIRHNYYSINIALELAGYRFYHCCLMNNRSITTDRLIISKQRLNEIIGDEIYVLALNNDCSLHIINKHAKDN